MLSSPYCWARGADFNKENEKLWERKKERVYIERKKKGKGRGLLTMVLFFSPFFHIINSRV